MAENPALVYLDTWQVRRLVELQNDRRAEELAALFRRGTRFRLVVSTMHLYELVRGVQLPNHRQAAEEAARFLDSCSPLFTASVPSALLEQETAVACYSVLGIQHEVEPRPRFAQSFQEAVGNDRDAAMLVTPEGYRTAHDAVTGFIRRPQHLDRVRELQSQWLDSARAITDATRAEGIRGTADALRATLSPGYLRKSGLIPQVLRGIVRRHLPRKTPQGIEFAVDAEDCLDKLSLGDCRSLAVEVRLLQRRVPDSDAQLEASFVLDVMHAQLAMPYMDVFAPDRQIETYLRDAPFPFPVARVIRDVFELLDSSD